MFRNYQINFVSQNSSLYLLMINYHWWDSADNVRRRFHFLLLAKSVAILKKNWQYSSKFISKTLTFLFVFLFIAECKCWVWYYANDNFHTHDVKETHSTVNTCYLIYTWKTEDANYSYIFGSLKIPYIIVFYRRRLLQSLSLLAILKNMSKYVCIFCGSTSLNHCLDE